MSVATTAATPVQRPTTSSSSGAASSLRCLAAIARHHGIDVHAARLAESEGEGEPGLARLLRRARELGLDATPRRLDVRDLAGLGQALPVLLRRRDGRAAVLVSYRATAGGGECAVSDPDADDPRPVTLPAEEAIATWDGDAVLLKRRHAVADTARPFGLAWFVPEFLKQRVLFTDVAVAAIALHVLALALPVFFQLVIDRVLVHQGLATLQVLTLGVVAALVFEAAFTFARQRFLLTATSKLDMRISRRVFDRLLSLPVGFFERMPAGVLARIVMRTERLREFLAGRLFTTVLDALALVVFLPVLWLYSSTLTLVVLACTGLIALTIVALIGPFRARLDRLYEVEATRQAQLVEALNGMATVKACALEQRQSAAWEEHTASTVGQNYRVGQISALAQSLTGLFEKLMAVGIIVVGAMLVFEDTLTVGALVAFHMVASRVSAPLVQLVGLVHHAQEALLDVRMLASVMNAQPERVRKDGLRPRLEGRVALENVSYTYPDAGRRALDGIDLVFEAGTVTGVVGRSGSGKTTLTRLLLGFGQPQEGLVRVDGHDLRNLDLAYLRRSIGVVPQEGFLFAGTVRENIAVTRPNAPLEDVVAAAKLAGADEFIVELAEGYDTRLEESARNLSGGQRQRLAIARALMRNPRILILDEATSALDPESEHLVQRNLGRIAKDRTVIIVSHRLASLRQADRIAVLDHGRLVALDRHEALVRDCSLYAHLWRQQTAHLEA
jgi:ATP-binding cassette subfamily B protein